MSRVGMFISYAVEVGVVDEVMSSRLVWCWLLVVSRILLVMKVAVVVMVLRRLSVRRALFRVVGIMVSTTVRVIVLYL